MKMAEHVPRWVARLVLQVIVTLSGVREAWGGDDMINFSNKTETEIMDELLRGYDPRLRPSYQEGRPTLITCNMFIRGIANIDQIAMQYSADILFRQEWNDPRVKYEHMLNSSGHDTNTYPYLNVYNYSALWTADLYFKNAREANYHHVIKDQKLLRVSPNGNILYSIRISMVLTCDMKLHSYPFDSQHCYILIGSFSQTTKHLVITWREKDSFGMVKDLELPEFKFTNATVQEITATFTTGNYSNLKVNILLEREIGFYMLQVYVPSFMIVIVSWVTFWLDVDAGPARVSLAITTFLTMHTMSSGVRTTLPPVSYTKAIDVWTNACTTYIFGALLEYALANYMARRLKKRKVQETHFMRTRNRAEGVADTDDNPECVPLESVEGADVTIPHQRDVIEAERYGRDWRYRYHCQMEGQDNMNDRPPPTHQTQKLVPTFMKVDEDNDGWSGLAMSDLASPTPSSQKRARKERCIDVVCTSCFTTGCCGPECRRSFGLPANGAKSVDVMARILFPSTFLCFNIGYWIMYVAMSEKKTIPGKPVEQFT